jgi:hypothetical protein
VSVGRYMSEGHALCEAAVMLRLPFLEVGGEDDLISEHISAHGVPKFAEYVQSMARMPLVKWKQLYELKPGGPALLLAAASLFTREFLALNATDGQSMLQIDDDQNIDLKACAGVIPCGSTRLLLQLVGLICDLYTSRGSSLAKCEVVWCRCRLIVAQYCKVVRKR